jgi:hypothetical protein
LPVTIPFTLLARPTVSAIPEFSNQIRTLTCTFRPANIHVFGPSEEFPHVTHTDQALGTLAVRVTISVFVFTRTAESAEVVMAFGNRAVVSATRIDPGQTHIRISR